MNATSKLKMMMRELNASFLAGSNHFGIACERKIDTT